MKERLTSLAIESGESEWTRSAVVSTNDLLTCGTVGTAISNTGVIVCHTQVDKYIRTYTDYSSSVARVWRDGLGT